MHSAEMHNDINMTEKNWTCQTDFSISYRVYLFLKNPCSDLSSDFKIVHI
jgi:hypothetical protein